MTRARRLRFALPFVALLVALGAWEAAVRLSGTPAYVLPAPSLIASTLARDWPILSGALLVTLGVAAEALALAIVGGVALALLFSRWRWIEWSLLPFAVALQVTPVVAISPLLLVYLSPHAAVLVCAFLVAFFPVLSSTAIGLASADAHLGELFDLHRASPWRRLLLLRAPSALPYFLSGLRVAGGLALVGAVVAEIAAGSGGAGSGLAFRIVEAGFRLNIPRMFAALVLIGASGVAIHLALVAVSAAALRRWPKTEGRERS